MPGNTQDDVVRSNGSGSGDSTRTVDARCCPTASIPISGSTSGGVMNHGNQAVALAFSKAAMPDAHGLLHAPPTLHGGDTLL